ncbi:MAG TPA: BatA domain-containing protein, partial [Gemmataceae bacterium]
MTFLNLALLAGLIAVLIPPIIHLLNRRKYDTVDWAAMQFLQVSQRTRRKIFLEELLLMAMRMGLIAVLVLALAAPVVSSDLFTWMKSLLGTRSTRDVALVFDGSASMGYRHEGKTAAAAAAEWAGKFLDELAPGDGVGVVQARPVPVPVLPALLPDRRQVRAALEGLPEPAGSPDTPSALNAALQILSESKLPRRELVVLTDNQRHGWADERTLERWELLTGKLRAEGAEVPRVWVVNVAGGRPADPPNAALAPVTASRAVAVVGREVRFQGAVQLSGEGVRAPREVRVEIDERPAGSEPILSGASSGQVPFRFTRRFATPGSHLVTLRIPDDAMPGDNRQDFALEVVRAIPVLLVDGDPRS